MPETQTLPDPDNQEEVRAAARLLTCPRCGAAPGLACQTSWGRIMTTGMHAERRSAAIGGPTKEDRPHPGRRQHLQRKADPEVRIYLAGSSDLAGAGNAQEIMLLAREYKASGNPTSRAALVQAMQDAVNDHHRTIGEIASLTPLTESEIAMLLDRPVDE